MCFSFLSYSSGIFHCVEWNKTWTKLNLFLVPVFVQERLGYLRNPRSLKEGTET